MESDKTKPMRVSPEFHRLARNMKENTGAPSMADVTRMIAKHIDADDPVWNHPAVQKLEEAHSSLDNNGYTDAANFVSFTRQLVVRAMAQGESNQDWVQETTERLHQAIRESPGRPDEFVELEADE